MIEILVILVKLGWQRQKTNVLINIKLEKFFVVINMKNRKVFIWENFSLEECVTFKKQLEGEINDKKWSLFIFRDTYKINFSMIIFFVLF